ncbi:MAG: biotin/lipoyl-containing protein [Elusimicrobiales bacterium]|jgi:pyruvate carboxylase subunit B|nr:biotin/lipoyl-containing protein [Elusimicrobiales bacterium]
MKKIDVMVTAFRDGFQSVYGARVLSADFLPAVEAASRAGVTHFEAGGGAMFQSLYFYCNEDAFAMMDAFRLAAGPGADLQTLARGVNVVGLDSQPADIIKLHAELFKKHGITTIRNFDALNDVNNLIYSGRCIKEAGLRHEAVVSMMSLPPGCPGADRVHTPGFYAGVLRSIMDAGIEFDSVCFKDASGTATPAVVRETMRAARALLGEGHPLRFHTHDTAGTGVACYLAALEGGADALDLSMAPVSGGTSQPDILSMWHALRGTEYDLGFDIEKIVEAEEVLKECMKDYFVPPESKAVEPLIPFSPMPGGALTANTQMMRDNRIMDKYPAVIKEMSEVVRLGGYGTSVTPVSQFYFQQAYNNVMMGRWKKIAPGYGKMVLGYFGRTPLPADPEVVAIASAQLGLPPTTKNPMDMDNENPAKGAGAARKKLAEAGLPDTPENVFIAAACLEKGIAFLQGKAKVAVRKRQPDAASNRYTVTLNGANYKVEIKEGAAVVNGTEYRAAVKPGFDAEPAAAAQASASAAPAAGAASGGGSAVQVKAPMPGQVFKLLKKPGDTVALNETFLILEAMKMEIPVKAPSAGSLSSLPLKEGDQVHAGDLIAEIKGA